MSLFIYMYMYLYIHICVYIISFLLGFWVIFNNCIFFTHSLTLFQNKHLVLGIWYCQSIQNPRPNTCWFLIKNLVSHGILTYFQTNSVKIFKFFVCMSMLWHLMGKSNMVSVPEVSLGTAVSCLSSQLQSTLIIGNLSIASKIKFSLCQWNTTSQFQSDVS